MRGIGHDFFPKEGKGLKGGSFVGKHVRYPGQNSKWEVTGAVARRRLNIDTGGKPRALPPKLARRREARRNTRSALLQN